MDRFGGSLPVKGYSGEMAGKKRVQLPVDLGKGRHVVCLVLMLIVNWRTLIFYITLITAFPSSCCEDEMGR